MRRMGYRRSMRTLRLLLPILILLVAGDGLAQSTANLSGNVTSDEGNALADVSVTLVGPQGSQVRKTNDSGQFRFLSIAPGDYQLTATLSGYGDVTVPGTIKAGQNAIDIKMAPALHLRNE
jgi:uncharacterized surface anchored protein